MLNIVYMVLNLCVKMSYIVSDCGVEEIDGSDVELFKKVSWCCKISAK